MGGENKLFAYVKKTCCWIYLNFDEFMFKSETITLWSLETYRRVGFAMLLDYTIKFVVISFPGVLLGVFSNYFLNRLKTILFDSNAFQPWSHAWSLALTVNKFHSFKIKRFKCNCQKKLLLILSNVYFTLHCSKFHR